MRRKHGIVVWIILTLILTRLHIGLYGQEALTQKERNRLIQKRWSFYLIKDLYNDFLADEIIATIKACYPNEVDSMAAVGLRFVEEQAWDQAYPWFELCFRREPDNIHANYGYAICKRESGKNMAVLGREGDWNTSEKHFRRVITLDSTYQDILYQYALLKLYRKNHLGAIQLAHRQLQANPNTHSGQIGLFRIYYSIIHELKSGEVESLLKARTTLYDRYYLGELHRINEKTEDAEKLFLSVIQQGTSFPLPPVFLSLVRLYVQENQPDKAEKMYWQAVYAATNRVEADLFLEDFLTIVDEKEYQFFKKDMSISQLPEALKRFWLRRDPLPSLPYNTRLINHYHRINYAEKEFLYEGFRHRTYKEYASYEFHFPPWYSENYRYNDMGLIYIRHGDPDDRVFAQARDAGSMSRHFSSSLQSNMSWLYYQEEETPQMIFHFTVPKHAPPGYWTLVPGFQAKEIWDAMSTWPISRVGDYMQNRVADVEYALQSDRHTWPAETIPLEMFYSIDQFKKNDDEETIELSFGIPISGLFPPKTTWKQVELESGYKIFAGDITPVYQETTLTPVSNHDDSCVYRDCYIHQFSFDLIRTEVNITVHARLPAENKLNGWRFVHDLREPDRSRLSLSTLKLAHDISPTNLSDRRYRDRLKIIPNPTKIFRSTDPIYVYYEIYDLAFNDMGNTDYTVDFSLSKAGKKGFMKRVMGIFGSGNEYQISLQSAQQGDLRTESDFIVFDMSKIKKGDYELTLKVRDNLIGEQTQTKTDIILK